MSSLTPLSKEKTNRMREGNDEKERIGLHFILELKKAVYADEKQATEVKLILKMKFKNVLS